MFTSRKRVLFVSLLAPILFFILWSFNAAATVERSQPNGGGTFIVYDWKTINGITDHERILYKIPEEQWVCSRNNGRGEVTSREIKGIEDIPFCSKKEYILFSILDGDGNSIYLLMLYELLFVFFSTLILNEALGLSRGKKSKKRIIIFYSLSIVLIVISIAVSVVIIAIGQIGSSSN